MIDRKRLLTIPDLNLAGKTEKMSEDELISYVALTETFIDEFPVLERKIQSDLQDKDYKSAAQGLNAVKSMLEKIFAEEKARECAIHIKGMSSGAPDKREADLNDFLASVSTLSISIQMADFKNENKKDDVPSAAATSIDKQIHVLAVDDAAFFLNILKRNLSDPVFNVTCLSSGVDALRFIARHKPDIFILDIEMPTMNGYELAQKIRDKGHTAPIIFLTGNAKRESVIKAVRAGAVDFIVKPGDGELIKKKIYQYVQVQPAEAEKSSDM